MKFTAAVSRGTGDAPTIEELELEAPRAGEMRVRLVATGICHTDLHEHPGLFLPKLAEYWRQGRFPFDRLLSFYPFAEIDRAFADARSGKAIKPVLLIGETA